MLIPTGVLTDETDMTGVTGVTAARGHKRRNIQADSGGLVCAARRFPFLP